MRFMENMNKKFLVFLFVAFTTDVVPVFFSTTDIVDCHSEIFQSSIVLCCVCMYFENNECGGDFPYNDC